MLPASTTREALLLLENRGTILDVARDVSQIMRESGFNGSVIGGIAVVLHGHVRTTRDVDVLVAGDPGALSDALVQHGYVHDPVRRHFVKDDVPVYPVTDDLLRTMPRTVTEIDGICTVELADLISMKLHSGMDNMLRAQDLADAIGLIRVHRLGKDFASKIHASVRKEFRRYADAVSKEG